MKYVFYHKPFPDLSGDNEIVEGLPQSDGTLAYKRLNDRVISVQPDGGLQDRDMDEIRSWERSQLTGACAAFLSAGVPHLFTVIALP